MFQGGYSVPGVKYSNCHLPRWPPATADSYCSVYTSRSLSLTSNKLPGTRGRPPPYWPSTNIRLETTFETFHKDFPSFSKGPTSMEHVH